MPQIKLRDGAELYYEKHGNGPPLFLVAGLGGDGRFWGANVEALAGQFTVIVHDHRGTGRSTLSPITYSVAQMADDALQLIEALGYDKVHWCGHSTGGAMGQALAIEHPERIDRLVLRATWAKTDAFFRRLFEVRALTLKELGPEAYLKSSALALNMPSWVRDHDADLAAAEAQAKETIPVPKIVLSRIAAIVAHDRRDQLQKVRAPTLAICARDRTTLESTAAELRAHGGRVLAIPTDVKSPDETAANGFSRLWWARAAALLFSVGFSDRI